MPCEHVCERLAFGKWLARLFPDPMGAPRSRELPPTRCSRLPSHRWSDVNDESVGPGQALLFCIANDLGDQLSCFGRK